mmetsp:Transcript_26401/g.55473  ORF Transcript_26401/g.55473 Transcript_26401/m.55473 type:complete len:85 (-) Transcript_26401:160-414(-)
MRLLSFRLLRDHYQDQQQCHVLLLILNPDLDVAVPLGGARHIITQKQGHHERHHHHHTLYHPVTRPLPSKQLHAQQQQQRHVLL